ncbi:MAG: hypothetical protein AAB434_13395 [Planctomycetota bacterium]
MRRVFFAVDGEREIWRNDPEPGYWALVHVNEDGAAAKLVQRILSGTSEEAIEFQVCGGEFRRMHTHARESGKPLEALKRSGYEGKLQGTWALAKDMKCCGVVVLVDTDRSKPRSRWQELSSVRECAQRAGHEMARWTALGEATRCFEAWVLGSAESIHEALGGPPCSLPPSLESQQDPKALLEQYLSQEGRQRLPASQMYAEICARARVKEMATRCPVSFAPFVEEVIERLGPSFGLDSSAA